MAAIAAPPTPKERVFPADIPPEPTDRTLLHAFERLERWLFALRLRDFTLLVLGIMVVQNGLWPAPHVPVLCRLSSDLTRQMTRQTPGYDFFYSGPLQLVIAGLTGLHRSILGFAAFHLALTLAGIIGLTVLMRRRFGDTTARLFLLTFAATPLSTGLFTWLGISDVYVFILATLLVVTVRPAAAFALAVLLGFAHYEQGAVIVAGLTVWQFLHAARMGRPRAAAAWQGAAMLGGVALAHACASWYYAAHGFQFRHTRTSSVAVYASSFPTADLRHFQSMVFSFHSCVWLVVAMAVVSLWRRDRTLALAILLAHAVAGVIACLVMDETRVFCVLIWPLLVLLLLSDAVPLPGRRRWVVAAFAGSLVVPHLIFWGGYMHSGALFYDGDALVRVLFGDGIKDVPNYLLLPLR